MILAHILLRCDAVITICKNRSAEAQSEVGGNKTMLVRMSFTITMSIFFAGWICYVMFSCHDQLAASPVEPDAPLRRNPQVLKPAKIPEKSSGNDSETSNREIVLTEDEWDSEDFDALSTDAFTIPEPLVDAEEKTSKYPPVPDDYPFTPIWLRSEAERAQIPPDRFEAQELLSMAMIKLWNEGDRDITGSSFENGTFYPKYPDVAYVKWEERKGPDSTISRYASRVIASNSDWSDVIMDQLNNGKTPEGSESLIINLGD